MTTVETGRGRSTWGELAPTLAHEHVFILDPAVLAELRARLGSPLLGRGAAGRPRDPEAARLRAAGNHTLVDPTVPGVGRHIPWSSASTPKSTSTSSSRGAYAFPSCPSSACEV